MLNFAVLVYQNTIPRWSEACILVENVRYRVAARQQYLITQQRLRFGTDDKHAHYTTLNSMQEMVCAQRRCSIMCLCRRRQFVFPSLLMKRSQFHRYHKPKRKPSINSCYE